MLAEAAQACDRQFEQDEVIIKLASMMREAFAYIPIIRHMKDLTKTLEAYVYVEVTLRPVECAIFVKEYCGMVRRFCR